jgi:hypothetical protein
MPEAANEFWSFSRTPEYSQLARSILSDQNTEAVENGDRTSFKILAKPSGYWNNVGIVKPAGVQMIISYSGGTWRSNPYWGPTDGAGDGRYVAGVSYLRPGAPEGCLIGKIGGNNSDGGSETFVLGNFGYVPVQLEGLLWLTVNDEKLGFGDNSGYIWVTVS